MCFFISHPRLHPHHFGDSVQEASRNHHSFDWKIFTSPLPLLRFPMHHGDAMIFHQSHCHCCRLSIQFTIHWKLSFSLSFFSVAPFIGILRFFFLWAANFWKSFSSEKAFRTELFPLASFFAVTVTVGAFWKDNNWFWSPQSGLYQPFIIFCLRR